MFFSRLHTNDIITMTCSNGEKLDFRIVASVELMFGTYVIAQPLKLLAGMKPGEALVYRKTFKFKGAGYKIVLDDKTIDKVFAKYHKMLDRGY